jgi:SAM-dependent methyltransferase
LSEGRLSGGACYIHGTGAAEQRRLSRLNDLLNAGSLRELAPRAGERVLDVGCGQGQLARAISRATGVQVVGVERDAAQAARARALASEAGEGGLLDVRLGDAAELPLAAAEVGAFDVAHARFVLEHVRDPLAVVRAMVRAVRPGGRVVLSDDDHDLLRLHPEPPGLRPAWEALVRAYDRNGSDPFVGRRLPSLLHAAGAAPRRITWVFFGACAGEPDFPGFVENLAQNLLGARDLVAATGLEAGAVDAAAEALDAFGRRPDAAIWYAMAWAEGVRTPGARSR